MSVEMAGVSARFTFVRSTHEIVHMTSATGHDAQPAFEFHGRDARFNRLALIAISDGRCGGRGGVEAEGVAGLRRLIGGGRKVGGGVGVAVRVGYVDANHDDQQEDGGADGDGSEAPVELGKLEGDEINDAAGLAGKRGRFAEFFPWRRVPGRGRS